MARRIAMDGAPIDVRLTALDRALLHISPGLVRRRLEERLRIRAYEAASPRDTWRPRRGGASADADHAADAATVRTKARYLAQNVPYISASLDALVAMVVGTGILPRATGDQAARLNDLFAAWSAVCDADGRLDYAGLQAAAYRAMEVDGEVLIRLRPRRPEDGLPVPLQIQLLEIDWLDTSRQQAAGTGGASPANTIVNGIEYDALGRVAAYWLWDQHPGDITLRRGLRTQSHRVPAESIVHLFDPKRPGQGRGVSLLAPVITRARDTQLLEDAELARKNLESRLSVLVSGDAATMAGPGQYGAGTAETGDPAAARRTGDLGQLASGGITELPPGVNISTIAPNPLPGHVENIKHHLHIITAALGVTYEQATGDMREVNFSSARVRQIDVRRQAEAKQWLCLVPRLCNPLWRAFVRAAELAGKVRAPGYEVDYSTPKWEYVNPAQEVKAATDSIAGGLASWSETLRRMGYKPDDVFAEMQSDVAKLKASGVLDVMYFLQKGKAEPTAEPATAQPSRAQDEISLRLAQAVEAIAQRTAAPQPITIHQQPAEVRAGDTHIHVPADAFRVDARIDMPEIRAGDVHVTNQVPPPEITVRNEVQAPAVHVSNDVQPAAVVLSMPARTTEITHERDVNGRIAKSITIERSR